MALTCFNPRARTGRDNLGTTYPKDCLVSIHAPARGATAAVPHAIGVFRVSIHAPARGATSRGYKRWRHLGFQSTRPHGARRLLPLPFLNPIKFQSTRPHGARRRQPYAHILTQRFNPRARTGRDSIGASFAEGFQVSIHAPARGATPSTA